MKDSLLGEAQKNAKKTMDDSQSTIQMELYRAISLLKQEFVLSSAKYAETKLKVDVNEKAHDKLGDNFIKNIQAAQ